MGFMGSYSYIPKAIFYLLEEDYRLSGVVEGLWSRLGLSV